MIRNEQIPDGLCYDLNTLSTQNPTPVCSDDICDSNYNRYIGYRQNNRCIQKFFSKSHIQNISRKITQLLQGVDPKGRPIIVPFCNICSVMSDVFYNYKPPTGDIYSRYTIPSMNQQNLVQSMTDQVIEIITSQIRSEMGIIECNSKLTKWTTVLGDFNEHGLTQTPPIKLREKRPNPMEFHMRY